MSVCYPKWLVYFVARQGGGLSERENLTFFFSGKFVGVMDSIILKLLIDCVYYISNGGYGLRDKIIRAPPYHRPRSVYGAYHFPELSGTSAVVTGLEEFVCFIYFSCNLFFLSLFLYFFISLISLDFLSDSKV